LGRVARVRHAGPPLPPVRIDRGVADDGGEPRCDGRVVVEVGRGAEGPEQALLEHVLGEIGVPDDPAGEVEQAPPLPAEVAFEFGGEGGVVHGPEGVRTRSTPERRGGYTPTALLGPLYRESSPEAPGG